MKHSSLSRFFSRTLAKCLLAWAGVMSLPAQPVSIRLGTILPRGVGQDFVLTKLEQDWNQASGGTVILRKSPGAQKDGEAGIVRRLHSRNYQAALLSAVGLSEIEPEVSVLQKMPLTFRTWEEVDFVRDRIRRRLEDGLAAKGFILLFWADAGWVEFFSVRQAVTPADFKRLKLFAWAADDKNVAIMKSLHYQPVALETDHVLTGLSTGLIDAAPLPPVFALGVQIQTRARHMLDLNWAPIVGAAIIRKDSWEKIPPELRRTLQALCDAAGADIRAEGRRFHDDAVRTLRKGPHTRVHSLEPDQRVEWQKLGDELGPKVRGNLVPSPIYDEVQRLLKEFRAAQVAVK